MMNFAFLNSLVTGPKILVAIGSSCLSNRTAAFLSNRIEEPSFKHLDLTNYDNINPKPMVKEYAILKKNKAKSRCPKSLRRSNAIQKYTQRVQKHVKTGCQ